MIDERARAAIDFAVAQGLEIEYDLHPVTGSICRVWIHTRFNMREHPLLLRYLKSGEFSPYHGKWCWVP